jgi:hypothetical protein
MRVDILQTVTTARDTALSPSPHAKSHCNLRRMGGGCPEDA